MKTVFNILVDFLLVTTDSDRTFDSLHICSNISYSGCRDHEPLHVPQIRCGRYWNNFFSILRKLRVRARFGKGKNILYGHRYVAPDRTITNKMNLQLLFGIARSQ